VSAVVVTVVVVTCLFNDTVSPVWVMHSLMMEAWYVITLEDCGRKRLRHILVYGPCRD
jgi:hypothetical protein